MIRVFPRLTKWTPTDELAFVGMPPLFMPPDQPVRISVVFTWDIPFALELKKAWAVYYEDVQIGGPAFGDPGGEFVPGRYVKEGVTITSRGCIRKCPWCFVSKREGSIRELTIQPGHIIQDNNLLACRDIHIIGVMLMLKEQRKAAVFSGGIDALLLKDYHRHYFDTIRIKEVWFACDHPASMPALERAAKIMDGIPRSKLRCYVMIGHGCEAIYTAEKRLEEVFNLGFDPFCQLYQGKEKKQYSKPWRKLARKWSRPAIYKSKERIESTPSPLLALTT